MAGCAPKAAAPALTELPGLEIALQLPSGMESISEADLRSIQADAAEYPPVAPFTDYPSYQFVNPKTGTVLIASKLDFIDSASSQEDPVSIMEMYQRSLAAYYGVDSIAARDLIQGEFRLTIMTMLYIPGGETLYLTKVIYYRYPHRYFMLDLYFDSEKTDLEEAQELEKMFLSVVPAVNPRPEA